MLNQCMLLRQYKNSPPKAQTTAFKNSLLKIGGVDARSLVEIKRRRIGYTLSIFSRGMDAAGYIRSDVSAVSETHSQNYTRMYSFDDATTQIPAYFQKVVDIKIVDATITQQLSNSATQQLSNSATQGVRIVHALINGQPFHSDNTIIIFSHQFLQTAKAVLVFLLLHTDATLLFSAYFVR